MTEKHTNEADYYHARVADMMAKAQAAPSKATRIAYLNLAQTWARKAAALEQEWLRSQVSAQGGMAGPLVAEQKN
ncbi:MAG TPA: hypothetical protein VHC39_18260 [Rhizomicrobium sp.]|nr:hypothetical protein [Rhizomicrobium sp.]